MKRALSWLSGRSAEQPADGATAWQPRKRKRKGKLQTSLAYLVSVARSYKTTMHRSSASAEQPAKALRPAEYMAGDCLPPPGSRKDLTEPPYGYCAPYRLAFYAIDWNISSKERRHTMVNLGKEICDIVRDKGADAMGISEVFNPRDDYHEKRQDILERLLSRLNTSGGQPATSADSSAEQPAWMGESAGQYIFDWNSNRLMLMTSQYISCGIAEQD